MHSTRFKFPTPTFKIDATGVNDAADATVFVRYFSRVHEWRRVLREQLGNAGGAPSAESGEEPQDAVVAILRWRAAVVDYLSDVWDGTGEPTLTLDECNAIGRLLAAGGTETRCGYCLAILEKSQHRGEHQCWVVPHLRSKWPPSPFEDGV